jgi:hypothetical protein
MADRSGFDDIGPWWSSNGRRIAYMHFSATGH